MPDALSGPPAGPAGAAAGAAPLRVVVADDEPLAREHLAGLLREMPGVEVAECSDGLEAVAAIGRSRPDLVLLDVAMPGLDGFDVIAAVTPERMPPVIFVTAYDEHAVRAFEVRALDYLLKPISAPRLRRALDHAVEHVRSRRAGDLEGALRELVAGRQAARPRRNFLVRRGDRLVVVDVAEVELVEAAANYVRLQVADGAYLYRSTLASVEQELPPGEFARIHRSALVRVRAVRWLARDHGGDVVATLASGRTVAIQRRHLERLKALLDG